MSRPNAKDADIRSSEHGTSILLIIFGVLLGIITVVSNARRWSAPAYQVALEVPGAPESWGWTLLFLGLITLYGYLNSRKSQIYGTVEIRYGFFALTVGMFAMGVWCLFFGITFLLQFFGNNTVSANGALINTVLAILYIQRSVMYWRGRDAYC